MQEYLNQTFWGNTLQAYAIAIGILIVGLILVKVLQTIILHRLKKWAATTETFIR